jgi:hypothetical protein
MSLQIYERNLKYGRTILIAGIPMLFETVKHALIIGIFMIFLGAIIIIYYNKKIIFEKRKEIIIKFLENNLIVINKKKLIKETKEIKTKEIKVIDTFYKKYELNNKKINFDNLDKIIYYDINYDNLTLFLDIYTFVKKYELIDDLNLNWNNKLLNDYYQHYYNIIAFISNLDNINDINIAITYLIDDYDNNVKILDNLIKDILISKNKIVWLNEKPSDYSHIIKYISSIFNYIISDNLIEKFDKFDKLNCIQTEG